jgi:hypothetical protein
MSARDYQKEFERLMADPEAKLDRHNEAVWKELKRLAKEVGISELRLAKMFTDEGKTLRQVYALLLERAVTKAVPKISPR